MGFWAIPTVAKINRVNRENSDFIWDKNIQTLTVKRGTTKKMLTSKFSLK
jgi:uncharacterized protein YtpQ (UPF0354 family)